MRKALLINWSPILNEGFSYSIASLSVLLHNLYLHPNQLTFIITWGRFVQLWHLHDYNMILFPWWCLCSSHNVCRHWKLENRKCKINVKAIITKNQNKIKKIFVTSIQSFCVLFLSNMEELNFKLMQKFVSLFMNQRVHEVHIIGFFCH